MALTGNPLLKLLVIPVVIGAILIGVSMMGKKESAQSQGAATPTVTSEEAATLGIDGDTPADTTHHRGGKPAAQGPDQQGHPGE